MSLWERLMLHFFPRHHERQDLGPQVEAALQRAETARRETDRAAIETVRVVDEHSARVEAERLRIQARVAEQKSKAHRGTTSSVRNMVDDMLRSYQPPNSRRGN